MGYASFSPQSQSTNISTKETSMLYSKFITDYNNGLIDSSVGSVTGYSVLVSNVALDQTVSCVITFLGDTYNRSYTSKYTATDSRSIYQEISKSITAESFIAYLNANGGNVSCKITSGASNFTSPITISPSFRTVTVANKTDFSIVGNEVDKPIILQTTSNRCYFELQRKNTTGSWDKVFSKASNTNTVTIPGGTITDVAAEYRIKCNAGLVLECAGDIECSTSGSPIYKSLTGLTVSNPTLTNLNYVGDLWERPITFNWMQSNQEGYEYELYSNNVLVKSGTGGTENSFQVPGYTFTSSLNPTIRIRNYRTYAGVKYYSSWVEKSLSLKDIEATISNLLVEGDYWEKSIKVSWQSINQQQFKVEVLKSNSIVKTYTGTTLNNYTIAAEQLGEGEYTIRVTVAYANRFVNSTDRTVTLKNIIPTVSDLALSGSNIDLALLFSWVSTDQQKYEVEILKDVSPITTFSGTAGTSVSIPHSTLTTGLHKFRVRVAYKDRWSDWKEYTANLTETLPSIGAFEPDGVITERDNPIRIWWTSQNQSKWKLVIDDTTTYTGTTEKEKILVAGALQTGKHSMVLTVTYVTSASVEKHITKKAEWIVQGKPPIPTITSLDTFTSSRPLFTWDTQDQQGYILDVLKDNIIVYSTDWQNGLVTEHKVLEYLPNGAYTIRVKIINQFSLESDYGSKQITINASEATIITLKTMAFENSITLTWDNVNNAFDKFYIIRNEEVIASTTGTTYTDYTAFKECIYTVRGVTTTDTYKDSNTVYEECNIPIGIMCTIGALDDTIQVGLSRKEFNFSGSIELSSTQIALSGRELLVTIFGEHSNNTYELTFTSKELFKFLDMCKRREIFLYRDKRQKLFLSISNPNYTIDHLGIEYSVQAIEVDYKEGIAYD